MMHCCVCSFFLHNNDAQGAGYVEFATPEEADAAMKLDGKELLGR